MGTESQIPLNTPVRAQELQAEREAFRGRTSVFGPAFLADFGADVGQLLGVNVLNK